MLVFLVADLDVLLNDPVYFGELDGVADRGKDVSDFGCGFGLPGENSDDAVVDFFIATDFESSGCFLFLAFPLFFFLDHTLKDNVILSMLKHALTFIHYRIILHLLNKTAAMLSIIWLLANMLAAGWRIMDFSVNGGERRVVIL